ncbi:hypothetical protein CDD83_7119 [Cordyceps sp. RAO-2017]|nr:hypothetical protein CDD83_7119 [Cordyceps sp. RAO-2017]
MLGNVTSSLSDVLRPRSAAAVQSRAAMSPARDSFPGAQPDWSNVKVVHRNQLPPRSHFFLYRDERDALAADVSRAKAQCLSGTWKFHLSQSPFEGPRDFHGPGFEPEAAGDWSDVVVPGMWQLQGHGKGPHYTNVVYPWPVDAPNISFQENECGRYLTTFVPDSSFARHQLRLRFEGVDSSFTVWINGHDVGYSQGSRNPSEFDVTRLVKVGEENRLAVEVYQRCDGSYIEDQDQWWLSGIFRDVYLHAFPDVHPVDVHISTHLDDKYRDAVLRVDVELNKASAVELKLLGGGEENKGVVASESKTIDGCGSFEIRVEDPAKWTAETPNLYALVLNFLEGDGCSLAQRVGFRNAGLVDGVFCVNGSPVKLRGVNRHEHHPDHGRAVPYDFMRRDLLLMKRCNINAIRTSHQPNDPRLYDVADELGLWVLDEADLECHGFGVVGGNPASYTSDNPDWREQYVDRARQLVARDRNHACVIMWSLGNEAFYGRNHQAMYDCIKGMDKTRLVHYEGDSEAKTADIFSRMYPTIDSIVKEFAKEREWKKPLVLCEFLHAMGNSAGNAKEYIEVFYKHPRLMGGFVWEWANHGLRTRTKDGIEYMGYGGDFGDEPNDYNFIMDGLIWSEHNLTPNLAEYAKSIEPVQTIALHHHKVTVVNRYDFLGLSHLIATWTIVTQSKGVACAGRVTIPDDAKSHTEATLTLESFHESMLLEVDGEAYLQLHFRLKDATSWAPANHLVATGELRISKPLSLAGLRTLEPPMPRPTLEKAGNRLAITSATGSSTWGVDVVTGMLVSWQRAEQPGLEMLTGPVKMDFYRALTDNDRSGHGKQWIERRLHQTTSQVRQVKWHAVGDGLSVETTERIAPPALAWGVDVSWTYSFRGDSVSIHVRGKPRGPNLPETFARIGLTLGLGAVDRVRWWGRGPGESYRDKKHSQLLGEWESTVDELWVDYEFPQDGGNRTDVRRVEFVGGHDDCRILRARFGGLEGASFSASRYTTADIDQSRHPYELHARKREDTVVRLDWAHHGLGGASCGPWTLPRYQLRSDKEFDYEILLD